VGSDSNVLIDAAEELRLLEYGQRLAGRGRARFASPARPSVGGNLFDSARAGGSAALGVSGGGIATGQVCDLVSLKADHPSLIGRSCDGLLDGWIFAAPAGAVDKVWRRGERVVEGGRHVRAEVIGAAYRRVLERVLAG
jgi:cytosine/adenosine deaminase-related metal-dependent hydrolase